MLDIVSSYLRSGLSVIPTDPIHKNPRIESWTEFQKNQPTAEQINKWFYNGANSPAIITGKVSGNVEMFDFDERARQFQIWKELVDEQAPGLIDLLPQQTTQNGGIHVIYRCVDMPIPGAKKLSMGAIAVDGPGEHQHEGKGYKAIQYRGKWVITPTLIETRGEGGYFLSYPGKGYQIVNGALNDIPNITAHERQIMFDCAEILSEYDREQPVQNSTRATQKNDNSRPGDVFNANVTIQSLLRQDGWRSSGRTKNLPDGVEAELWTRPGKQKGVSATVYDNKVHIFSSNCSPLEQRITYDPFSYIATTRYYGNFSETASVLAKEGYGVSESKQESAVVSESKQAAFSVSNSKQSQNSVSDCQQSVSGVSADGFLCKQDLPGSIPLAILIKEYVEQYSGTFYVYDVDREFSITTRQEKNNRAQVLNRLAKELKIKKVQGKVGCWKTVSGDVKPMKLGIGAAEPLDINLPMGLSELAQVLPGNIVLVAGAPNAGKTAFFMRSLYTLLKNNKNIKDSKNNANGSIKNKKAVRAAGVSIEALSSNGIRYLNSEMDEVELTDRCAAFPNGIEIFSTGCEFVQRYRDFADVIIPNGINFIDFLEIHEDFFELGKLINEIFENLTTGICFIAVQKKQDADYAKGGAASLEKPRLVINLDRNEGFGKKCKIVKCKKSVKAGDNHDGKEVDYDIDKNMEFVRFSAWRYVNEKQRQAINRDYERNGMNPIPEKQYAYVFRLTDGKQGRVLEHQVERWENNFPGINVREQLQKMETSSLNKPFLGDNWFYQIPNLIGKASSRV